jgi:hypothetical protein
MIALLLAVIAYCRVFFIGRHRLGWKLPHCVSNWSCSNVNSRGLAYSPLTEHFE